MTQQQRVLQFEYQQCLVQDSDRPNWSEEVTVSVRLRSEALSSGWYRDRFGKNGNDFVIFLAIAMHARPLRGPDLALLMRLGMARPEDEGRLYARISDMALADELGMDRRTIASATKRLLKAAALTVVDIPAELAAFRDSHGQFNGRKIYLLAGDLPNSFVQKDIQPGGHVQKSSTAADDLASDVQKSDTVKAETDLHRATFLYSHSTKSRINIEDEESEEEVNGAVGGGATLAHLALAYFAQKRGVANFQPSLKEQHAALKLARQGFSLQQIQAGIDRAFERLPPPSRFTHCAVIVRDCVRSQSAAQQAARTQPETRRPVARLEPETGQPETRGTATEVLPPEELARAEQLFAASGRDLSADVRLRLRLMAAGCRRAAQAAGSSGGNWLAEALTLALGQARPENLLGYAEKVLADWTLNGRTLPARRKAAPEEPLSPEMVIFQQATGRLPLRDQRQLAAELIRRHGFSADELRPFWQAWVGRDRKRSDLGWLEWAAQGSIPQGKATRLTGLDVSAATLHHLEQLFAGADDDKIAP